MRKLFFLVVVLLLNSGCLPTKQLRTFPQDYQKQLFDTQKNIHSLAYISKYNDYFIRKKINLVISGQVTKIDPFQNQWLFIVNQENNEQIMIDLSKIPTDNRPILQKDDTVKFLGPIIKDESLLIGYHQLALAYLATEN